MKQVCTEASNESFAGNSEFYEEKKDEEGRQERRSPAESVQKKGDWHFIRIAKYEGATAVIQTPERLIQSTAPT